MSTRRCAQCDREKSIRGVWYLTPGRAFVCEGCFSITGLEPVLAS